MVQTYLLMLKKKQNRVKQKVEKCKTIILHEKPMFKRKHYSIFSFIYSVLFGLCEPTIMVMF